jgi:threo-3-hydroxy-L-aspartate ammonia-lyase
MNGESPLRIADVWDAAYRLRGIAHRTPVLANPSLDHAAGGAVICKAEALQRTGSFKFRGAYNALAALPDVARKRGVICASSGNHAHALALAASLMDAPVTVVVPYDAPHMKISAAQSLGAEIVRYDPNVDKRDEIARRISIERGYSIIPSANTAAVMAGAGTVALEFIQQSPELATILVPVGGGGLAAGTSLIVKAVRPGVRVIGVEPESGNDAARSFQAGERVELPRVPATIADGLRHTMPAELPWRIMKELMDDIITVSDGDIVRAMQWAFEYLKIVVEPSGAVALAGASSIAASGGVIGTVLSGGSIDVDSFRSLVSKFPSLREYSVASPDC